MVADSAIGHVSDTALWVATFRANESRRTDPAFQDPLAAMLCGDRGPAIARAIPRAEMAGWTVVIRTSAIDRLIHEAVGAGVDTVLNLGAGLDTRPYRMKLPSFLRWLEVDFPPIVEHKEAMLGKHSPCCRVERVGLDLLDRHARNDFFTRHEAVSRNTLVITEGVLPYLSVDDVARLASDLRAMPSIRFWIQDFDDAGRRRMPRGWEEKLRAAPFLFNVEDWFEFFRTYGWSFSRVITTFEEAERIHRPYPLDFPFGLLMRMLPKRMSRRILSLSGAVMMAIPHD